MVFYCFTSVQFSTRKMISSKYFFPLRITSSFIILALFCGFGSSETSPVERRNIPHYKPAGYETLIPVFNSSREARKSVVSGGLFSIISFDNVPCNADSGDVGTCYSARECSNLQGTASGVCAGNYGVCCVVTPTCGATVTTNNTYFVNPGNPSTTSGPLVCSLTVNKLAGATELYLEFADFQIRGPTAGNCMNDTFIVSIAGSTAKYPSLCGNNVNQMLYYDISSATAITLNFNLASGSDARSWKIRIVQFKPNDGCAAPAGCFLYFRDPMGVVESFNYDSGKGEMINQNDTCVNICFQANSGTCGLLLTENEFMLGGMAPNECTDGDYILANGQQFCGDTLANGMLTVNQTMPKYYNFQYCSGKENPDMDVGFNLNYTIMQCPATG